MIWRPIRDNRPYLDCQQGREDWLSTPITRMRISLSEIGLETFYDYLLAVAGCSSMLYLAG